MENKEKFLNSLVVTNIVKIHSKNRNIDLVESFKELYQSKFFELINNPDTGLNLEDDRYLVKAFEIELDFGKDKMIEFVNKM